MPGKFYLNAGVYAQTANVDKAVQQLQGAKLNALRQTVSSSKGDLTRLRIGPFDTRQQAEQAAAKAKQLRIDASVFQHPRG
ncbi:SPOR domain-containing protein [Comamonas aquatica]|uniref:SPOR domain-containing protein n=1 Tax=Comamonas aquatica TaxID=225991 RepID=UPI001F36D3A8|nr:SPOR domain-containing protein [Comamonas aquatica]